MRLIDADALKAEIAKRTPHFVQRIEFTPCFKAIRDAKTVDAVKVVRCRDCMWSGKKKEDRLLAHGRTYFKCMRSGAWNKENWYCADGERRDDE